MSNKSSQDSRPVSAAVPYALQNTGTAAALFLLPLETFLPGVAAVEVNYPLLALSQEAPDGVFRGQRGRQHRVS